jgi:hypothetical protein
MKKQYWLFLLVIIAFSACIKDKHTKKYTLYYPEYATKQEVRDQVKFTNAEPINNMGSIALYNNYILATEIGKGIHIIDATNGAAMRKVAFVPIPGNTGMAVRNNKLYADCYTDLFVIDITNLEQLQLTKVVEDVFVSRGYFNGMQLVDGDNVVVDWIAKDTVVTTDYINNGEGIYFLSASGGSAENLVFDASSGGTNSVSGSMARFTLANQYLYTVDQIELRAFDLSNGNDPQLSSTTNVNWGVETIYPFKDKLFIGTQTGMYMYSLSNPASPSYISEFSHVRVCDPVIANDKYAFVTLRSGTACQGFTNQLDVLNIENVTNPTLIKSYPFDNPHGLSLDGDILFICDGASGLKVLNASNINDIKQQKTISVGEATDIIAFNGKGFVITPTAIKAIRYTTATDVQIIGEIAKQ